MSLKDWAKLRAIRLTNTLVCFIRKLWRPMTLVGVAFGTWVNLVYLPLKAGTPVELEKAAAFVASVGALSWIREWGKTKGLKD